MHPRESTPRELLAAECGVSSCCHWRDPFDLEDGLTVYLSASTARGVVESDVEPSARLYLDKDWLQDRPMLIDRTLPASARTGPEVLFVNWPGLGVVPVEVLSSAVEWAYERLKRGEVVEVGCLWGDGRTGTVAAASLVRRGWGADEAIEQVREAYCRAAIETGEQEELVRRYADKIRDERRGLR